VGGRGQQDPSKSYIIFDLILQFQTQLGTFTVLALMLTTYGLELINRDPLNYTSENMQS
jgi:hypothetical protein